MGDAPKTSQPNPAPARPATNPAAPQTAGHNPTPSSPAPPAADRPQDVPNQPGNPPGSPATPTAPGSAVPVPSPEHPAPLPPGLPPGTAPSTAPGTPPNPPAAKLPPGTPTAPPAPPTLAPVAAQGAGLAPLAAGGQLGSPTPQPGHGQPATAQAPANLPAAVRDVNQPTTGPAAKPHPTGARPGIELPPPSLDTMSPTAPNAPAVVGRLLPEPAPPLGGRPGARTKFGAMASNFGDGLDVDEPDPDAPVPGVPAVNPDFLLPPAALAAGLSHDRESNTLAGVTPGPLHTGDPRFGRSDVNGHPRGEDIDMDAAPPATAVNDDPNIAHVTAAKVLGMAPHDAAARCHERWLTYREVPPGEPAVSGPGEDRPGTAKDAAGGAAAPHDKASVMATRQPEFRADRINVAIGHDGLVSLAWVG